MLTYHSQNKLSLVDIRGPGCVSKVQKPLEYKESYLVLLRRRKDTDTITDTSDTSLRRP